MKSRICNVTSNLTNQKKEARRCSEIIKLNKTILSKKIIKYDEIPQNQENHIYIFKKNPKKKIYRVYRTWVSVKMAVYVYSIHIIKLCFKLRTSLIGIGVWINILLYKICMFCRWQRVTVVTRYLGMNFLKSYLPYNTSDHT